MLAYTAYVYSPLYYGQNRWENSNIPLTFFGLFVVLCIHFVFTGKALNQEKFSGVMWSSGAVLLLVAVLQFPALYILLFA